LRGGATIKSEREVGKEVESMAAKARSSQFNLQLQFQFSYTLHQSSFASTLQRTREDIYVDGCAVKQQHGRCGALLEQYEYLEKRPDPIIDFLLRSYSFPDPTTTKQYPKMIPRQISDVTPKFQQHYQCHRNSNFKCFI
jgi:hypothetical protein